MLRIRVLFVLAALLSATISVDAEPVRATVAGGLQVVDSVIGDAGTEPEGAREYLEGAPDNPFERGEYPIEEPWFGDLTQLREAHGLDSSRATMIKLMSSPDAQRQMNAYGVLLTPEEEKLYSTRQSAIQAEQRILTAVTELDGFAGSIVDDNSVPYALTILVTKEAADEAQAIAAAEGGARSADFEVTTEVVRFSVADLAAMASALGDDGRVDDLLTSRPHLRQAFDGLSKLVAEQPDLRGAVYGYSMKDNAVLAIVHDATARTDRTIVSGKQGPDLVVQSAIEESEHHTGHDGDSPDDQGDAACGRWWCGAPKGGHATDFDPGGWCTWAGSIQVKTASWASWINRHLTAGHCGDNGVTETYYNFAMQQSNTNVPNHFEIVYRRNSTTRLGTEWRNSIERSGDAWGDFLLVSSLSGNRVASNLVMTSSSSTSRITSLGTVSVGTDVCISVPHTDIPRCDEVDNIGWTKNISGKEVTHLVATHGSWEGEPGDSGGPLYLEGATHVLVGAHHGDKRNFFGKKFQLFSQVVLIDNSPNMGIHSIRTVPTDGRRDFVQGMYFRNLNRTPDIGGYNYWRNTVLSTCTQQRSRDVAWSFMNSTEFNNRFPITSGTYANKVKNAEFRVWYAYRTYYGRNPDAPGLNYWLNDVLITDGIDVSNAAANLRWLDLLWSFGISSEFTSRILGPTASVDGAICA